MLPLFGIQAERAFPSATFAKKTRSGALKRLTGLG
jgi:hypothetical protein